MNQIPILWIHLRHFPGQPAHPMEQWSDLRHETLVQAEGSLQTAIRKRPAGLAYRPARPEVLFQEVECVCCGGLLSGAISFLIEAQNS